MFPGVTALFAGSRPCFGSNQVTRQQVGPDENPTATMPSGESPKGRGHPITARLAVGHPNTPSIAVQNSDHPLKTSLQRRRAHSRNRPQPTTTSTTAGKPYSRAITAPWVIRAPDLRHQARDREAQGRPAGDRDRIETRVATHRSLPAGRGRHRSFCPNRSRPDGEEHASGGSTTGGCHWRHREARLGARCRGVAGR
jgi:hypothetical protein